MTPAGSAISPDVLDIMAHVTTAGIRLAPDGRNVRYWSPEPLAPELREMIIAHKAELIAALSVWCPKRALLLEQETDELVERLDVPGRDPEIVAAAARCTESHFAKDMGGVRLACLTIEKRARALASQRGANVETGASPG